MLFNRSVGRLNITINKQVFTYDMRLPRGGANKLLGLEFINESLIHFLKY